MIELAHDTWLRSSNADRVATAESLLRELPAGFSFVGVRDHELGRMRFPVATFSWRETTFALIPGGQFEIGWNPELWEPNDDELESNSVREELAAATPDCGEQRAATQSEWMTDATVAERLSISRVTLAAWRATAKGPPWIKLGRLVRYKTAHVNAWLEQHTRGIPRAEREPTETGHTPSTTARSAARTTSPRWRQR